MKGYFEETKWKLIEKIVLKPQLLQKVFEKDEPELGATGIDVSKLLPYLVVTNI